VTVDPFELDWGTATPEFVNEERRLALHVANHDLANPANVRRTTRFLVARSRWFARHLPAGWQQRVVIDDRGQSPAPGTREVLRHALTGLAEVSFLSEGGIGV
jgi:hypothetical protein